MGNLWLKIRIWTKVVLFSALAVYALLFVWKNWNQNVTLWIFPGTEPSRSVLLYMFLAFLVGVIGTILLRTTLRTIRQIRDLGNRSRAENTERRLKDMEAKAARLQTRPAETHDDAELPAAGEHTDGASR